MIGFNDWLKREYRGLLSKTNHSLRTKSLNDESYIRLYNCVTGHAERLRSSIDRLKSVLASSLLQRLELLIEQIIFLLNCPLHFYTHRTVEEPKMLQRNGNLTVQYIFNDRFVSVNKNPTFHEFNRLLQEGWKIYTDIWEEYFPVEHILTRNKCGISTVEFVTKSKSSETWFSFPLSPDRFIEIERKVRLTDEAEFNEFVEKLKEKLKIPMDSQQKEKIKDTFYDVRTDGIHYLRERGWTIRKRKVWTIRRYTIWPPRERKIIWGIKIAPVFWQRAVEYRLEFEIEDSDLQIRNLSLSNFIKKFAEKCEKLKTIIPIIDKINLKGNNELKEILTYKQNRESMRVKDIKISADIVKYNDNTLYIVEFEPDQTLALVDRKNALDALWEKLYTIFPNIDDKVYLRSKLDWALDIAYSK